MPRDVIDNVHWLRNAGINLSCVIILADVQADALRKFVDVPVITFEDFPRFGEKNFPVKPQEVFLIELGRVHTKESIIMAKRIKLAKIISSLS